MRLSHAAPACERSVLLERLADIFRASFGGVVQQRLELHLRRILDGVAALAKFFGFRLGTVNHGLRDARQRPHDRLRVETAGNERLAHAAQPRRGRFGADVAVLVPPQEAAGKIVRIATAAAEPLDEEGRRLSAVEVRKRHAQQFVLLDAAIEVLDQRRHAVAAAHRLPEFRAGIRDERFPAMAQFLVNREFGLPLGRHCVSGVYLYDTTACCVVGGRAWNSLRRNPARAKIAWNSANV